MDLPQELRLGLERELRTIDRRRLGSATSALSTHYRGDGRVPGRLNAETAAAYAAARMPATYGAAVAALRAVAAGLPGFAPHSLLDVGSGTGAALWAAATIWDSLNNALLLERDEAMANLGRRLAERARRQSVAGAVWRRIDLLSSWATPPHDLVTAAYVLGELAEQAQTTVVDRLWSITNGALVLIEPGTPRGWATIRAARERLRTLGATIVAPCPHQAHCPMPDDDWCHFAQRIARTAAHRAAKGAELGYEDEKYSYIAVSRGAAVPVAARVLRRPISKPGRIDLALCTATGLRSALALRSSGIAWSAARNARWGDGLVSEALEEL